MDTTFGFIGYLGPMIMASARGKVLRNMQHWSGLYFTKSFLLSSVSNILLSKKADNNPIF